MPQMAIIQPATPKGPQQTRTAGTAGNKEQNTFSPHLDKAVSNNRKQQQVARDDSRTKASSSVETQTLPEQNSSAQQSQNTEDTQDLTVRTDTTNQPDELGEHSGQVAIPDLDTKLSIPGVDTELSATRITNTASSQLQQIEPTMQRLQNTAAASTGQTVLPMTILPGRTPGINEPTVEEVLQPTVAKEQNALLSQLQRIIDQGDETGIVSITKATETTSTNSIRSNVQGVLLPTPAEKSIQAVVPETTGSSGAAINSLLVANTDGAEQAGARPSEQLSGIRQDNQQQHLNPKIATAEAGDNKQNFQSQQQSDEPAQQSIGGGSLSSPSSGISSSSEQPNTFSQIITTTQQTTAQQTSETAKPILLPSGTLVQEENIFQQLSNKLQISGRNMDSRINLKLHPAELGSLKIDLTVKEGSIRANVVAQSQHTSEILEKNMAKLKSILENQGFTVDEISVTTESDSASEFNLFDQQLFSQNDYAPKAQKGRREDEPVFTLPSNVLAAPATSTGVNVKI